jgi:uncharacterized protein YyaL (SSP411 family)
LIGPRGEGGGVMVDSGKKPKVYNHLIQEKSPYLLQHAENPVDWYPWNEEAFQKAREEDKPVFLSIGYATCHWCHVMAHESFEDPEVAHLLNRSFVSIKVDREERPDIDQIYMSACQALTGQGGWPLSIFMTPERAPFFAGTYFPKSSRMGLIGFTDLLQKIADLWKRDRERILQGSREIRQALEREDLRGAAGLAPDLGVLKQAYQQFRKTFDETWGGFGTAPKFPTPHHLTFLLRWYRRSGDPEAGRMVERTLEAMRRGGIFDQVGLGFHRYSVDEKWLIPHFEKMLYDQALLAMAYTEACQAMKKKEYGEVAREIFTYVLRDMTSPEGGFYSAEDADSEGREGRFYVWKPEEIKKYLGEEKGDLFCRFYGITPEGNFEEGFSVPHISQSFPVFAEREKIGLPYLEESLRIGRETLFRARKERVHPLIDDKIITSWNGLMIAALAKGCQALQDPDYSRAASRAADFFLRSLRTPSGGIFRRYRQGDAAIPGFLEDYAFFVWGLIELYEATFQVPYLEEALLLHRIMMDLFWDRERGGFYFTGRENEDLITRSKELYDGAMPSGNSVAALNLWRLGRMTGNGDWEKKADQMIRVFSSRVADAPMAYTQFLNFLDFALGPSQEIVVAGGADEEENGAIRAVIQQRFQPNKILLFRPEGDSGRRLSVLCPFVAGMHSLDGKAVVYICEDYACKNPVTGGDALAAVLG